MSVPTRTRPTWAGQSRVRGNRLAGRADVPTAELDRVNNEWRNLVQRDAILPTRRERRHLLVGGEASRAEAAEQSHHREIELAVPAGRGGIDEPTVTARVDEPVAGPEVAVQTSRRFVG